MRLYVCLIESKQGTPPFSKYPHNQTAGAARLIMIGTRPSDHKLGLNARPHDESMYESLYDRSLPSKSPIIRHRICIIPTELATEADVAQHADETDALQLSRMVASVWDAERMTMYAIIADSSSGAKTLTSHDSEVLPYTTLDTVIHARQRYFHRPEHQHQKSTIKSRSTSLYTFAMYQHQKSVCQERRRKTS
jgi:hypothetical protein